MKHLGVRMRTILVGVVAALQVGSLGCATQAKSRKAASTTKCPAAGATVPLAKVMNSAFIRDYEGCDITVDAQFLKPGNEMFILSSYDTDSNATFQVVEPGGAPQAALGGLSFGKFCGIAKKDSDLLFTLKAGDKVRLRGAPIAFFSGGTFVLGVFQATSVTQFQ